MTLFVISWMDRPDSFALRAATRDAHFAHIARHVDKVRLGGPFIDEEGRMIGSMIVFEADTLEEAQAFHESDPYALAGLFEQSTIMPWRATVGALPARAHAAKV